MKRIRSHWFGEVPSLSPSEYIRRFDTAVLLGALVFIGVLGLVSLVLFRHQGGGLLHLAQLGQWIWANLTHQPAPYGAELATWTIGGRWLGAGLIALGAGLAVAIASARPQNGVRVIAGNQLYRGPDAIRHAQAEARRLGGGKHGFLHLHPAIAWPAEHWAKTILCCGGVGSGKSQILLGVIQQLFADNRRFLAYEPKGDFVARFPQGLIVSPFDQRSCRPWETPGGAIWWVARDVATAEQAHIFATSFIASGRGHDQFWTTTAQMLVEGSVKALQARQPGRWTFADLAQVLSQDRENLAIVMAENYAKAYNLIGAGDTQTTASIMAILASETRMIDVLGEAWGEFRQGYMFSFLDWAKGKTKARQVFLTAGQNKDLTAVYVAAIINVLTPFLLSPSLPDNPNRHLFFLLDELPSLGKMPIQPLVEMGRSKGIKMFLLYQSQHQLIDIYGANAIKALTEMVGTKIYCRLGPGETRDALVKQIGKHRVSYNDQGYKFEHGHKVYSHAIKEKDEDIILASDLTDELGPVGQGRHFRGNTALVQTSGDLYQLTFPAVILPAKRPGQIEAEWVKRKPVLPGIAIQNLKPDLEPSAPARIKDWRRPIRDDLFG